MNAIKSNTKDKKLMHDAINIKLERYRKKYHTKDLESKYKQGDYVWYKGAEIIGKLDPRWSKKGQILELKPKTAKILTETGKTIWLHTETKKNRYIQNF
ncbi:hypothetical protein BDAP_002384 [Binucleata daphniae]